jgi:hypothetical protein
MLVLQFLKITVQNWTIQNAVFSPIRINLPNSPSQDIPPATRQNIKSGQYSSDIWSLESVNITTKQSCPTPSLWLTSLSTAASLFICSGSNSPSEYGSSFITGSSSIMNCKINSQLTNTLVWHSTCHTSVTFMSANYNIYYLHQQLTQKANVLNQNQQLTLTQPGFLIDMSYMSHIPLNKFWCMSSSNKINRYKQSTSERLISDINVSAVYITVGLPGIVNLNNFCQLKISW